jgi:putative transposase
LPDGENAKMKNNSNKYHRKSIRLKGYDYSQAGAYFVTIVTQNRQHLFGEVKNGGMVLNAAGEKVEQIWHTLPERFPQIELDAFVVMPNHVHGIIVITDDQTTVISTESARETPLHQPEQPKDVINQTEQMNDPSAFMMDQTVGAGLVPAPMQTDNQPPLHQTNQTDDETTLGKTERMNDETPPVTNQTVGAGLVPALIQPAHQTTLGKTEHMKDETELIAHRTPGAPTRGAPTEHKNASFATTPDDQKRSLLGDVVGAFKSLTTHAYVMGVREHGWPPFDKRLWQRDYYERIIRSENALTKARAYTEANPQNWENDHENPKKQNAKVKP